MSQSYLLLYNWEVKISPVSARTGFLFMYSSNDRVWLGIFGEMIYVKIPGKDYDNAITLTRSELKWIYKEVMMEENETLEETKQNVRQTYE